MKGFTLIPELLKLSVSQDWDIAKREWIVDSITYCPNNCLCGHDIMENIHIINSNNSNIAVIGNCCITLILDYNYTNLFSAVKKEKVNKALIQYAYDKNLISHWEYSFINNVLRKSNLTPKQILYKQGILERITSFAQEMKK